MFSASKTKSAITHHHGQHLSTIFSHFQPFIASFYSIYTDISSNSSPILAPFQLCYQFSSAYMFFFLQNTFLIGFPMILQLLLATSRHFLPSSAISSSIYTVFRPSNFSIFQHISATSQQLFAEFLTFDARSVWIPTEHIIGTQFALIIHFQPF